MAFCFIPICLFVPHNINVLHGLTIPQFSNWNELIWQDSCSSFIEIILEIAGVVKYTILFTFIMLVCKLVVHMHIPFDFRIVKRSTLNKEKTRFGHSDILTVKLIFRFV